MTEQPNREVTILNEALELGPSQRVVYLERACAGDTELLKKISVLVSAHAQADDFLETPPAGLNFQRSVRASPPLKEKPGDKIGHYKLLQQIGEGGCGVVYMSEQQAPVRRRVALKVIKLGMDTKQVIARFEAERQALALMDHPNIAKVLDAGTTEAGRPYFVMELVRGVKITDFCDEQKVSTKDRLKLFIQVCQAIQHAHQKGIIHRDIKPSNILVTVNDGVPVPKVIDFGIAKATQGRLTDKTLFTAFEQFIGTPAYMSPEQAMMTSLDIDTRSDIYSLGVLLYELITGKTPFDQTELLAAGLDAMRQTIREHEPKRPSVRLSTMAAETLTTAAAQRQIAALRLIHLVRGDLDWIAMKSLEKDRARRYETANALAEDVRRYLSDEPVVARPPSGLYRLRKALRRHRRVVAAAAVFLLILLTGMVVSMSQAIRANRAEREQTRMRLQAESDEKKAQAAAAKSEQVAQFLQDTLTAAGPSVARGRDTTLLREILEKTATRIELELKDQPEIQGEIWFILGDVYQDIGERAKSEAVLRRALTVQRKVLGTNHPEVANTLLYLALAVSYSNPGEAESLNREALEISRKVYGNESLLTAACLNNIAFPLVTQGKLMEAEACSREALSIRQKRVPADHPLIAMSLRDLGVICVHIGKTAEGEKLLREALALYRQAFGEAEPNVAFTLNDLAGSLLDQNRLAEAEAADAEALAIQSKLYEYENLYISATLAGLSTIYLKENKLPDAERAARQALSIHQKHHPDDWETFSMRSILGAVIGVEKRYAEAEPLLLSGYEGLNERRDTMPQGQMPRLKEAIDRLVRFYEASDRPDQAAEWSQKLSEFEGTPKSR